MVCLIWLYCNSEQFKIIWRKTRHDHIIGKDVSGREESLQHRL
jgi:hypothetical protein